MPLALVFGAPAQSFRTQRTLRALSCLQQPNLHPIHTKNTAELLAVLDSAREPLWLLRAGAFPIAFQAPPPPSHTQKPLLALGATRRFGDETLEGGFDTLLAKTGGDLKRWPSRLAVSIDSLWVDQPAQLYSAMKYGHTLEQALMDLIKTKRFRAIRAHELDVRNGDRPRIMQIITTLHRGGAEQLALYLHQQLQHQGIDSLLCVLDKASRDSFDAPPSTIFLSQHGSNRNERFQALISLARDFGADILHTHLLEGEELSALSTHTPALIVHTLHNEKMGWPQGMSALSPQACALWISCSLQVEQDARSTFSSGHWIRTVWNAVEPSASTQLDKEPIRAGIRAQYGIPSGAPLLLSVANYRPQKRLPDIPELLAELNQNGPPVYALIVGENQKNAQAAGISQELRDKAQALGVSRQIIETGSEHRLERFYAAADLLISQSAHEGLSMAFLEALSFGLPLVVREVGGTLELAQKHPNRVSVVPQDKPISHVAQRVREQLQLPSRTPQSPSLAPDFHPSKLGERHALLYKRILRSKRGSSSSPRPSLTLITNNFSTGGAQTSARRLLIGLHAQGIAVKAAVLQEQPQFPTPGRASLERHGIPVFAAPRAEDHDPLLSARAIAAWIDESPPSALLFWNVIPEHKILLADMLLGLSIFDISPGEMYFASLERYFQRPRTALPYLQPKDYGRLLAGAVVKYQGEAQRAEQLLGTPVSVIPNGLPIPAECPTRLRRKSREEPLIAGTLARISPDKKLEQLLDAAEQAHPSMPAWELRIGGSPELGEEDYARRLRERASHLPVRWMGEAESQTFLNELDLFVMISEPAGCPNASLEAMAQGLPIIATDHGGVREQIETHRSGLLVHRGDSAALAEAMIQSARDAKLRERLGQAAYERAKTHFSVDLMIERYRTLTLPRT